MNGDRRPPEQQMPLLAGRPHVAGHGLVWRQKVHLAASG